MIRSLTIHDASMTPVPWAAKVPRLASGEPIVFGPGLTILWGANGAGKSTLLRLLARIFHCEQSYEPVVTTTSLQALLAGGPPALTVDHDGQGVRLFDPAHAVGLDRGHFDEDFYERGVVEVMCKGSAGQTTMRRFNGIAQDVMDGKVPSVRWAAHAARDDASKVAQALLAGTGEKGPPTLLLDEPDRSLDVAHQLNLWRFLRAASNTTQIIVAAHSLFALEIPEATFLDLDESRTKAQIALGVLKSRWPDERPHFPKR